MPIETVERLLTLACRKVVEERSLQWNPRPAMMSYITQAAHWLTTTRHPGLMLCGTPGNGKTTIVMGIIQLVDTMVLRDYAGEQVDFHIFTAQRIVDMAREDVRGYRRLCNRYALAIDDFGAEPAEVVEYGNIKSPLTELLYLRYTMQLPTIITTNTGNRLIRQRYGDRIADRFNEMMQVIICQDESYRGKNKQ